MNIEQFLDKLSKSSIIDAKEFLIVSGALWTIVALKNTQPVIFKDLVKIYGKDLEDLH